MALPTWLRRHRPFLEIDDELAFHVDAHIRDLIDAGIAPDDARRQALAAFGGLAPIREQTRDASGGRWRGEVWQDLAYAARTLRQQPSASIAAILTLVLGIGANTAIFSMVNGLLLRTLPVREPAQLVLFSDSASEGSHTSNPPPSGRWGLFSSASFEYLRRQRLPLASIGAFASGEQNVVLGRPGELTSQQHARAHLVSGNYFDVIGATPALGRPLVPADDSTGAQPVVVASDLFWRERLGADPGVIGRAITLNGTPFDVVGVMPPEFFGERVRRASDIWVPLVHQPQIQRRPPAAARADLYWLTMFGRLGPTHTMAGAQAATVTALHQFLSEAGGDSLSAADRQRIGSVHVQMVSGARGLSVTRDQNTPLLMLLWSAVSVVLLIACTNVATLSLARALSRERESAVRRALGASRGRLVRQWLTESLLVASLGAIGGVTVARWAAPWLFGLFVAASSPARATIDGTVLAFTIGVTFLSSLIVGLLPALRAGGVDPRSALRAKGAPASSGRRLTAMDPLVIAQIAMSMALVVCAALLVRTVVNLERAPLGFDRDHIVIGQPHGPHRERPRYQPAGRARGTAGSRPLASCVRATPSTARHRRRRARTLQSVRRVQKHQQPQDRGLYPGAE